MSATLSHPAREPAPGAATWRGWIKRRETPAARALYATAMALRSARLPVIRPLHRALYAAHTATTRACAEIARVLWYTPLFVSRLANDAPGLYLYGGLPQIIGDLHIEIGRNSRVCGKSSLIGRAGSRTQLIIGENVDIGWQNTISIGTRVLIGNNVRLAGRVMLAGFPGHPLDAQDRAAGLPDTADQIGDIVIEDDAWLATGVMVMPGVRIGRGSIIAAGAIVTRDIPPMTLAAGSPARAIRALA